MKESETSDEIFYDDADSRERSKSVDSYGPLHKIKETSAKVQQWVLNKTTDRKASSQKPTENLKKKDDFF